MEIENQEIDLMEISPDWFYRSIPWNKISKLCNVKAWQGPVKKGEETMAEHAVSFCVAVPYSDPMTGPLFASTFLANIADFFVKEGIYDKLYVNGDSIMKETWVPNMETKDAETERKDVSISFSFYKYVNGVSFIYFGFPNYSSKGDNGIGMSKKQIEGLVNFATNLSIAMLQTSFVNGLFASIGGK